MIDSTNPRIIANNIKKLLARINAIVPGTVVAGNPSGSGFNTLLTKIKIGDNKYKLPANVVANPEDEATGTLSKISIGDSIYSIETGGSDINYTDSEVKIGKYMGSDLYKKTVNVNTQNLDWVVMNDSNCNILGFDSCASFIEAMSSSGYHRLALNSSYSGTSVTFIIDKTSNNYGKATIKTTLPGGGPIMSKGSVTLYYTK